MKKTPILLFLLLVSVSYFTIGSLGLKTESDCVIKERNEAGEMAFVREMNPEELILCYHEVAITYAYMEEAGAGNAADYCERIAEIGLTSPDQSRLAETQRNLCFKDIAAITANRDPANADNIAYAKSYCSRIAQADVGLEPLAAIKGDAVTQSICHKTVENIYNNSRYSCPFLFVFGGTVLSFLFWQHVHKL